MSATATRCPRCSSPLMRSREADAAGECLSCGPVYVPMVTPAEVEADFGLDEPERQNVRSQRARGAAAWGTADTGCSVSRSCLECPLSRCKYDGEGERERRREMDNDGQVFDSKVMGEQCVRALRAIALRVSRMEAERATLIEEAKRLGRVAALCEVEVPAEFRALVGGKPGHNLRGPGQMPGRTFRCNDCGHISPSTQGMSAHRRHNHAGGGA